MKQKQLTVFEFEGSHFEAFPGPDGDPWFWASDVCAILDLRNVARSIDQADLADDEKGILSRYTLGGEQKAWAVSESGLYGLLMLSRKSIARRFQRHIRREVLPAIRKHGFYVDVTHPDVLREVLDIWTRRYGKLSPGGLEKIGDGLYTARDGIPINELTKEEFAESCRGHPTRVIRFDA